MSDSSDPSAAVGNTYFRLAGVVAVVYAIIDFLILAFGTGLLPLRFVGVVGAFFVIMDVTEIREAGVMWGWTRYLLAILVAVGGFLGFVVYAYSRYLHLNPDALEELRQSDADETAEVDGEDDTATDRNGE